jgi:hypothetical protein
MELTQYVNITDTAERMKILADVIGAIDWTERIETLSDEDAKRLLRTFDKIAANFVSAFDKLNWSMMGRKGTVSPGRQTCQTGPAFSAYSWIAHSETIQLEAVPAVTKPALTIRWPTSMAFGCDDCTRKFSSMVDQQAHARVTRHRITLPTNEATFD